MTKEQKQKFKELAKLSERKGVPEGWVYVGFGTGVVDSQGLGFGNSLRMRTTWNTSKDWEDPIENFCGDSKTQEYAAPLKVWNKVIGPDTQELIALSKQSFAMAAPAETVYVGTEPVEPCFEFTEGHYCMDRREWESRFGDFTQPLPETFSIRRYWARLDDEIQDHLMDLGYGYPEGISDNFIHWDGKNLSYQAKSDLIPLPLEVLFSGEERKRIDIPELGVYINGDNLTMAKGSVSVKQLVEKLKEHSLI